MASPRGDVKVCPSCGAQALRSHCESRTCTWVCCRRCQSWGEDSGRRWVDTRKAG